MLTKLVILATLICAGISTCTDKQPIPLWCTDGRKIDADLASKLQSSDLPTSDGGSLDGILMTNCFEPDYELHSYSAFVCCENSVAPGATLPEDSGILGINCQPEQPLPVLQDSNI